MGIVLSGYLLNIYEKYDYKTIENSRKLKRITTAIQITLVIWTIASVSSIFLHTIKQIPVSSVYQEPEIRDEWKPYSKGMGYLSLLLDLFIVICLCLVWIFEPPLFKKWLIRSQFFAHCLFWHLVMIWGSVTISQIHLKTPSQGASVLM